MRARFLPVAIALVVSYVALFPNRAGRETVLRPAWSTRAALPGRRGSSPGEVYAFRVADAFGYVDASGALVRVEAVFGDVTLDDRHYANYAKGSETIVLRSRDGGIAASVPSSGWPLLHPRSPDSLMVFAPDLLAVGEYGRDGSARWWRELGSLVTCYAPFPDEAGLALARCAVGTLDGALRILAKDGAELGRVEPSGSRIAAAYGCAVSGDGLLVAAVLGLDPQRLVLLDVSGGKLRQLWSRALPEEERSERLLGFSGDSRYLLVERSDGVGVWDLRGRRSWEVTGRGRLWSLANVGGRVAASLRAEDGGGELLLLALPDLVLGRAEVSDGRYLRGYDAWLVHGSGTQVTRLDVVES